MVEGRYQVNDKHQRRVSPRLLRDYSAFTPYCTLAPFVQGQTYALSETVEQGIFYIRDTAVIHGNK